MNKTKLYLAIIFSILSTNKINANTNTCNYFKSGSYSGLAVGYSYMNAGINDQLSLPAPVTAAGGAGRATDISHNIVGDILLGYRHFVQNGFIIGVELDLGRDNNKLSKNEKFSRVSIGQTSVRSTYKFIPAVVIGQQINDRWLGYAKLGMSLRRFKINHNVTQIRTGANVSSQSFNKNKTGFMAAVGGEYAIDKNVSATCDVAYERFQKINLNYDSSYTRLPGTNSNGSVKPSYVTVKVGVLYRF